MINQDECSPRERLRLDSTRERQYYTVDKPKSNRIGTDSDGDSGTQGGGRISSEKERTPREVKVNQDKRCYGFDLWNALFYIKEALCEMGDFAKRIWLLFVDNLRNNAPDFENSFVKEDNKPGEIQNKVNEKNDKSARANEKDGRQKRASAIRSSERISRPSRQRSYTRPSRTRSFSLFGRQRER